MTPPLALKFQLVADIAKAEKELSVNPNATVTVFLSAYKELAELALERLEMER